jgi:hypothetical protein
LRRPREPVYIAEGEFARGSKRDKLVTLLGPAAETGDISVLIELLSLPGGERFPRLDLNPQQRQSHT